MAFLRDDEIRRLSVYLTRQISNSEQFAKIEDELKSEFGAEFLREPEILTFFPERKLEINFTDSNWTLRIIPYTSLRMIQRGISVETIESLFKRFLAFCQQNDEVITIGAYTIFGKPTSRSSTITLRLDIDEIEETKGKAHTVTVFVGRGNIENTIEITLS